jgi:vancomycin resistance protein YoaR
VQNLRVAAARLDGKVIAAGESFSFWRLVGPPRRRRNFTVGRELREGCMVATIGGGLCQLSNALHLAALDAGFEIVERHPHTRAVPGSIAAAGRDAAVFWNYKDLRFRSAQPFVVDAGLTDTQLIVRLRAAGPNENPKSTPAPQPEPATAGDCLDCRHRACVYRPGVESAATGPTIDPKNLGTWPATLQYQSI